MPFCPSCGSPTGFGSPPPPTDQLAESDPRIAQLRAALADRYDIGEMVGQGGMALVFRAYDRKHGRAVALKMLRPEIAAALGSERFQREVEIAARFTHPHILPLYDSGDVDGVLYYVMPFVEGQTLRERLRREGPLSPREAVRIAGEIADALAYAHEHGIVHRDIKPANVLLESGHAVVTDFGVAQAVAAVQAGPPAASGGEPSDRRPARITATGLALGTPAYMSPEQAGGAPVDGRADIYALGCVLHEMLTGRTPYTGDSAPELIAAHALAPPPAPRIAHAPRSLGRIVQRALTKTPDERYATAEQFSHALAEIRFPSVRRRALALGGAALVVVVAAVTYGLWPRLQLDDARVVVFPFSVTGAADTNTAGEDVASSLRWALIMSDTVRGEDGWPLLDSTTRAHPRALTDRAARELVVPDGAARYLRGEVRFADSLRVHLSLVNVRWRTREETHLVLPLNASAWDVGLRAAPIVLSWMLAAGVPLDTAGIVAHPRAIAPFLAGERAYHRANFTEASHYYREALEADSGFVLAYVRAAQALSWEHDRSKAKELLKLAIARDSLMPPRYRPFLRGLHILARSSYDADSAAAYLEQALTADPRWSEAWMALGEVHMHMIAGTPSPDSAAEAAFAEVRWLDPTFTPVLYHQMATDLWRGDLGAARSDREAYLTATKAVGTGTTEDSLRANMGAMLRCVGGDLDGVVSPDSLDPLYETVRWMATAGLRQPRCAIDAARTLMTMDRSGTYTFPALIALQSLFVATDQIDSLRATLDPSRFPPAFTVAVDDFAMLDAMVLLQAGNVPGFAALTARAESRAGELRSDLAANRIDSLHTWLLGSWEAAIGDIPTARQLAERLVAKLGALRAARDTGNAADSLEADIRTTQMFVTSLRARVALAEGDTARALEELASLHPVEGRSNLEWFPWSSLGWEQVARAQLLLATGQNAAALRAASVIDSPASVPLVMYLPASLHVREEAARRLGQSTQAQEFANRLAALRSVRNTH